MGVSGDGQGAGPEPESHPIADKWPAELGSLN
jgi:hypothetical protein